VAAPLRRKRDSTNGAATEGRPYSLASGAQGRAGERWQAVAESGSRGFPLILGGMRLAAGSVAMSASVLNMPASGWIISRRNDLFFFIGSAFFGYLLIAFAVAQNGLPPAFLLLYAFAIDGPHVFSTLTRSLFDASERSKLRRVWLIGFPTCVATIGALAIAAGTDAAFVVVACLSHYHISKQHMGFMMIYKRKARETGDYKLDKYFTLASLMLPLGYYLSRLSNLGIPFTVFLTLGVALAGYYTWHQLQKSSVNAPKLLLLAAFIPLQWLTWSYAAADPHSVARLVAAGVAMNVGHSFQYLRLMYFHNHNRYAGRRGLLGLVNRKALYFMAAAIFLALPNFISLQLNTFYLSAFVVGMLLFHFVVDARIWRVRGDKELAQALKL